MPLFDFSVLQRASRDPVINRMSAFSTNPPDQWLGSTHPASQGQFLEPNGQPIGNYADFQLQYSDDQIVDVLATTAPHHCTDGWSYLARALGSLLAGDTHATRHLAYYAQLRATLSILNTNGVGVFNGLNFVADQSGVIHRLDNNRQLPRGPGTHRTVWPLIEEWVADLNNARVFMDCVQFRDVPLSDCAAALGPPAVAAPYVSEIIASWGIDLQRSARDRNWRNVSSYDAHALNPAPSDIAGRLELVRDLWLALEPDGFGGYPELDRYLLRNFLEIFKQSRAQTVSNKRLWDNGLEKLDSQIQSFATKKFLDRQVDVADLSVITIAASGVPGDVHAMVCRALLLLRTATAIVRTAFVEAGFQPLQANLMPWFEIVGLARGFWQPNSQPGQVDELWDVINDAVSDLSSSLTTLTDQLLFIKNLSSQTDYLSQAERAYMWGICP